MSSLTETNSGTGQQKTEQAKQAAGEVAVEAKSKASDLTSQAKSEASSVVSDAKDQAADVLHKGRGELRERASEQTKALSSTLDDLAGQLGDMAQGGNDPDSQVARLARSAAEQMQQGAQRLDDGGLDGLVDDVKRFARNRPGAFLLGAVAAGFAVGRLAKHADLQQAAQQAKDGATPDEEVSGQSEASAPSSTRP